MKRLLILAALILLPVLARADFYLSVTSTAPVNVAATYPAGAWITCVDTAASPTLSFTVTNPVGISTTLGPGQSFTWWAAPGLSWQPGQSAGTIELTSGGPETFQCVTASYPGQTKIGSTDIIGAILPGSIAPAPADGDVPKYSASTKSVSWAAVSGTGTVTSSGSPAAGNISKFTTATNIAPAAASDIVNLFSACSGTQYLGADGACHNGSGVTWASDLAGSTSSSQTVAALQGKTLTIGTPAAGDALLFNGSAFVNSGAVPQGCTPLTISSTKYAICHVGASSVYAYNSVDALVSAVSGATPVNLLVFDDVCYNDPDGTPSWTHNEFGYTGVTLTLFQECPGSILRVSESQNLQKSNEHWYLSAGEKVMIDSTYPAQVADQTSALTFVSVGTSGTINNGYYLVNWSALRSTGGSAGGGETAIGSTYSSLVHVNNGTNGTGSIVVDAPSQPTGAAAWNVCLAQANAGGTQTSKCYIQNFTTVGGARVLQPITVWAATSATYTITQFSTLTNTPPDVNTTVTIAKLGPHSAGAGIIQTGDTIVGSGSAFDCNAGPLSSAVGMEVAQEFSDVSGVKAINCVNYGFAVLGYDAGTGSNSSTIGLNGQPFYGVSTCAVTTCDGAGASQSSGIAPLAGVGLLRVNQMKGVYNFDYAGCDNLSSNCNPGIIITPPDSLALNPSCRVTVTGFHVEDAAYTGSAVSYGLDNQGCPVTVTGANFPTASGKFTNLIHNANNSGTVGSSYNNITTGTGDVAILDEYQGITTGNNVSHLGVGTEYSGGIQTGSVVISGSTSGSATIKTAAAAGSPIIQLPTVTTQGATAEPSVNNQPLGASTAGVQSYLSNVALPAGGSYGSGDTGLPKITFGANAAAFNGTFTVQPASDAVALIAKPVSSGVQDPFEVYNASGAKSVWVDASGNLNFTGNTLTLGASGQTSSSQWKCYGSTASSNLSPCYFEFVKEDGSIPTFLTASTTFSGLFWVNSSTPTTDIAAGAFGITNGGTDKIQTTGASGTAGLVQCVSAADTTIDCGTDATEFIGVAAATGNSNTRVKTSGYVSVSIPSSTVAINDYICTGVLSAATYNAADYGTGPCPPGQQIGFADSSGSSQTTVKVHLVLQPGSPVTFSRNFTNSISSGESSTIQNQITLYSWYSTNGFTNVGNINFAVSTTDNSANSYDLGVYGPGCLGGATVPLVAHTGTLAGTSLFGSGTGMKTASLAAAAAGSPRSGGAGWYCLALTSSAASPAAVLSGDSSGSWWLPFNVFNTTTGGGATLPSTLTAPSTSWGAHNGIAVSLYQ